MAIPARTKYVMDSKPAPRAGLTLFCAQDSVGSLWARIVISEKDVDGARIEWITPGRPNHDFLVLNPAQTLPTLADRDTVIHPAHVIAEYLDERYPHPRLLPPDPATRARLRMAMMRFGQDLFPATEAALRGKGADARAARKTLADALLQNARLFPARGWFLGTEFSLADCGWAALFWQARPLELKFTGEAQNMIKYAERLFSRPAVQRVLR